MAEPIITLQDIERIAELAALELTDEEKRRFVAQFEQILTYFRKIDAAPLTELQDPAPDNADPLRDDVVQPSDVHPDQFSPHLESGHFKVPRIIE